ncbi:SPFH domain-containing protein [Planotetraspora mira]|uniref:Band 7 domain-containing protein n=1 Tax=Planotetraspora mira TaxID=58121 RepID=A0A8J3X730_9ACTN|nr:SPFH domain-containing protein [Planotetraspora mira]GII30487.1 hypothetical protein Pmi06nite_39290 [Planotetraspora mira]
MIVTSTHGLVGAPMTAGVPQVGAIAISLILAAVAAHAFRFVRSGHRLVVFRPGRPAIVKGPGLVLVLPGLDRAVRVPLGPDLVDLPWIEAVTRDGAMVTVNGAVLTSVRDPVSYARSMPPPRSRTAAEAETVIRGYVAKRDLADLSHLSRVDLLVLAAEIGHHTRDWGVEATRIEISRVEVQLTQGPADEVPARSATARLTP